MVHNKPTAGELTFQSMTTYTTDSKSLIFLHHTVPAADNTTPQFHRVQVISKAATLLLMLAMSVTAWGQTLYSGFTAIEGTAGAGPYHDNWGDHDEFYDKLVDGIECSVGNGSALFYNKWCIENFSSAYIEFKSDNAFIPSKYIMTTAGDAASFPQRNPKSWKIMGKLNECDDWTTLVEIYNNNRLASVDNCTRYEFDLTNTSTPCRYFRFEVSAIQSGNIFQLSELMFRGTAYSAPEECSFNMSNGLIRNIDCGSCCVFYDDGGPAGDYSANANQTATITSSGPITINFEYLEGEDSYDYISVYDGGTDGTQLINQESSTPGLSAEATSGTMTIVWRSNGSDQNRGWKAFITTQCPPCPAPTNLTVTTVSNTSAHVSWDGNADANSYTVSYRVAGGDWTTLPITTLTEVDITSLTAETTYEVQVQTNCDEEATSEWTSTTYYNRAYAAALVSIDYGSGTWCNGSTRPVTVTFRNAGTQTWYNDGLTTSTGCNSENPHHRTFLSYTWQSANDFSGRIPLGHDVAPGETVTFTLSITAEVSGNQNLLFKFRRSECEWFNADAISIPIEISTYEAPVIAVSNVTCLNGATQVVLNACTNNQCTWTRIAGATGSASGTNNRNYTVTPTTGHNMYQVAAGSCTNAFSFDIPGTVSVSASPSLTICYGREIQLTASGNDGAIYNWYNSSDENVNPSNPIYTLTPEESATYYVNASYEQPDKTMVFETPGRYEVTVPDGLTRVKLEVWGAQGGNGKNRGSTRNGGNGGYSAGTITNLSDISILYVYVGGQGVQGTRNNIANGGYNGGGKSGLSSSKDYLGGSGGGATHIATADGLLNSLTTADQRASVLVVAGGGGGASQNAAGGSGGGTDGLRTVDNNVYGGGGTQEAGGAAGRDNSNRNGTAGGVGIGGNGYATSASYGTGGGGGGWYGGGGGARGYSGGGGSGYVKNTLLNSSTNTGAESMPNPYGGTMTGKTGNGYARITFYGQVCTSANTQVNVTVNNLDADIQFGN